jgi:hypothetical protein
MLPIIILNAFESNLSANKSKHFKISKNNPERRPALTSENGLAAALMNALIRHCRDFKVNFKSYTIKLLTFFRSNAASTNFTKSG